MTDKEKLVKAAWKHCNLSLDELRKLPESQLMLMATTVGKVDKDLAK